MPQTGLESTVGKLSASFLNQVRMKSVSGEVIVEKKGGEVEGEWVMRKWSYIICILVLLHEISTLLITFAAGATHQNKRPYKELSRHYIAGFQCSMSIFARARNLVAHIFVAGHA